MKRKIAALGLAAMLALSAAACDTVDDPGDGGTTLPGAGTIAPDLTVPSTTLAP